MNFACIFTDRNRIWHEFGWPTFLFATSEDSRGVGNAVTLNSFIICALQPVISWL